MCCVSYHPTTIMDELTFKYAPQYYISRIKKIDGVGGEGEAVEWRYYI